ncbi:MAG: S-layer homology domain-containing protein [Clostridiales bacterium]|nr:S-layer homology domain-containing protein [Clostridiales bacterium]
MNKGLANVIASLGTAAAIAAGIVFIPVFGARADGEVEINSTNFPDPNFMSYVKSLGNGDDVLTKEEIAAVENIYVYADGISDLTGIKFFTSLKYLNCSYNNLKSLDLSGLDSLEYLECDYNDLTSLDLSGLDSLEYLECDSNELTSLDLSGLGSLEEVDCSECELTKINLSGCTALKNLDCSENYLEKMDLSSCSSLECLDCYENNLTTVDANCCPALKELWAYENPLTSIYFDKCDQLEKLDCSDSNITSLYVDNPNLKTLYCGAYDDASSDLQFLDCSRCTNLTDFVCRYTSKLTKMYLPKSVDEIIYESDSIKGNTAEPVVLTAADWEFVDVTLTEGDTVTASANFKCIKEGSTDYKRSVKIPDLTVVKKTDAECEKDGSIVYTAVLKAEKSLTGKEVKEDKTVVLKATGHSWGDWKVTTPATVDKEGIETRCCTKCDASETRNTPKATPTPTPTATPTAQPTKADTITLTLDKKEESVICGKTVSVKATLTGSSDKITWTTSDKKVATVDANGKVSAKMAGTVTITAAAAGKSATCTVTVLYKDVTKTKDFWFAPTNYLTAKGVVKGYDKQTKFKPANNCTRAQMVTFIWRLMGEPAPKAKTCKFKDVKEKDYFYKACIWGNENKIVEGYKDGTFGPQIVCARKHAVTFLWRLAGQPKPKTTKNPFKDVKKSDYFYKATLWASEQKILAGYSDGTFKPNGDCLRRQMVTFLYKYDKFINNKG